MKNLNFSISEEFANDLLDDDIDQLYCQLEQIEPPAFLVDSIMVSVAQLPQAQLQTQKQPVAEELASSLNDLGDFLMRGMGIQLP
jgi:hypothetical protein